MSDGRLPNFLIIGAAKAGTTSLYHHLRTHPDVFMPATKELNFFVADRNWRHGIEWYARQFAGAVGERALGEASPTYTMDPFHAGAADRIAEVLPHAKLVYVVRNRIDQLVSHYGQRLKAGVEADPIVRALLERPPYLDSASYGRQLANFLRYFQRNQVLVLRAEELRSNPAPTVAGVFRFLGVDETWTPPGLAIEHNVTGCASVPRPFVRRLIAGRISDARLNEHLVRIPGPAKRILRLFTHRREPPPGPLPEWLRDELTARLADDEVLFRQLLETGDASPGHE